MARPRSRLVLRCVSPVRGSASRATGRSFVRRPITSTRGRTIVIIPSSTCYTFFRPNVAIVTKAIRRAGAVVALIL